MGLVIELPTFVMTVGVARGYSRIFSLSLLLLYIFGVAALMLLLFGFIFMARGQSLILLEIISIVLFWTIYSTPSFSRENEVMEFFLFFWG